MYKLIGSFIAIFLFMNSASAQVSSKAVASATIVNPVGVEMEEKDPGINALSSVRIIGIDQLYSVTVWNGKNYIDVKDDAGVLMAAGKCELMVSFE